MPRFESHASSLKDLLRQGARRYAILMLNLLRFQVPGTIV